MPQFKHIKYPFKYELKEVYNENGRYYRVPNGNLYPSITTVLSTEEAPEALKKWRERLGEEEATKFTKMTANRGQAYHTTVEKYLNNDPDWVRGQMPDIIALVKSVIPFLNRIDKIYGIETALYSDKIKVAGRSDLISSFDTLKIAIIDHKTSNSDVEFVPEKIEKYLTQSAAYSLMWEEQTGVPIHHAVLMFSGNYKQCIIENIDSYKEKFIKLRETCGL